MGEVDQERAQDISCAALKADQPAERLLGSKCPCRIAPGDCYVTQMVAQYLLPS